MEWYFVVFHNALFVFSNKFYSEVFYFYLFTLCFNRTCIYKHRTQYIIIYTNNNKISFEDEYKTINNIWYNLKKYLYNKINWRKTGNHKNTSLHLFNSFNKTIYTISLSLARAVTFNYIYHECLWLLFDSNLSISYLCTCPCPHTFKCPHP